MGKFVAGAGVRYNNYVNENGVLEILLAESSNFRSWLAGMVTGTSGKNNRDVDEGWSVIGMIASYRDLYDKYYASSEALDAYDRRLYVHRMLRDHHNINVWPAHIERPDLQNPQHLRQVIDELIQSILFLKVPVDHGMDGPLVIDAVSVLLRGRATKNKTSVAKTISDLGVSIIERGGAHYLAVRTDNWKLVSLVSKVIPWNRLAGDRWVFCLKSIPGAISDESVPFVGHKTQGSFPCVLVPVSEIAVFVPHILGHHSLSMH